MDDNMKAALARADELFDELQQEYGKALTAREVTPRAQQLTHEVLERLRSALDRTARRYFVKHVAPQLTAEDAERALIYFPIASDQQAFDSTMGRWRWKAVRPQHAAWEAALLAVQPFSSSSADWLEKMAAIANEGKHIDLVPQKRIEQRTVHVTRQGGGGVSWGPGVTFGAGVSVMGAPIDPRTQRIVPTPGVEERLEIWVSFVLEKYRLDARQFADQCRRRTRSLISDLYKEFDL